MMHADTKTNAESLQKLIYTIHRAFFSQKKKSKFQIFFLDFSYYCSKHISQLHVISASMWRFLREPTIYVSIKNKNNRHTSINARFTI